MFFSSTTPIVRFLQNQCIVQFPQDELKFSERHTDTATAGKTALVVVVVLNETRLGTFALKKSYLGELAIFPEEPFQHRPYPEASILVLSLAPHHLLE